MTSKRDRYSRTGMGNRIGFGENPAIVVVDVQRAMTDPDHPLGAELSEMITQTNRVTAAGRAADVPIIFTIITYPHPEGDIGPFGRKASTLETLTPESEWTDLDPRVEVTEDDYILDTKRHQSAFHGTELNRLLHNLGVDTVIATGCSTSGCVRATVTDASAHGYRPIVPREAVSDRFQDQHEANLFDMDAKLADVVDTDDAIAFLESLG